MKGLISIESLRETSQIAIEAKLKKQREDSEEQWEVFIQLFNEKAPIAAEKGETEVVLLEPELQELDIDKIIDRINTTTKYRAHWDSGSDYFASCLIVQW